MFSGCISIIYVYRWYKCVATWGLSYLFSELCARVLGPMARSTGARMAKAMVRPTSSAGPKLQETSTMFSGCKPLPYVYRWYKCVATWGLSYLFSELCARVLSPLGRSMGTRTAKNHEFPI